MTLRQLGDWVIWVGSLCLALVAIGVIVHWVAVRPLKAWLEEELIEPLDARVSKVEDRTSRLERWRTSHVAGHPTPRIRAR